MPVKLLKCRAKKRDGFSAKEAQEAARDICDKYAKGAKLAMDIAFRKTLIEKCKQQLPDLEEKFKKLCQ